jgi:hypothetical protein
LTPTAAVATAGRLKRCSNKLVVKNIRSPAKNEPNPPKVVLSFGMFSLTDVSLKGVVPRMFGVASSPDTVLK